MKNRNDFITELKTYNDSYINGIMAILKKHGIVVIDIEHVKSCINKITFALFVLSELQDDILKIGVKKDV